MVNHRLPNARHSAERRRLGADGESRAASYLEQRGYRIIERNVRLDGVEVDLITRRRRLVCFVEVKTRRSERHGPAAHAVDVPKQRRLVRAATAWIRAHPGAAEHIRFDVVTCHPPPVGTSDPWRIEHLAGAFDAG